MRIEDAAFELSAPSPEVLPTPKWPEFAVIGRSNAGKSTFINRFVNKKELAKSSSTPGKTSAANFFSVRAIDNRGKKSRFSLIDLPGYGYAKLSKSVRSGFETLILHLLHERESLSGIIVVVDVNRDPEEEELTVQRIAFERDLPLFVLLSKVDRLNQRDKSQRLASISKDFNLHANDLFISSERKDIDRLREAIIYLAIDRD